MKVFAAQSDCCDLRAGAWQAPLSMGFLREASWSRLPFPAPGDLPEPGIKPRSPVFHVVSCIAGRFCTNWASWEAQNFLVVSQKYSYFLAVVWGGFRNGMRLLWFFFSYHCISWMGKSTKENIFVIEADFIPRFGTFSWCFCAAMRPSICIFLCPDILPTTEPAFTNKIIQVNKVSLSLITPVCPISWLFKTTFSSTLIPVQKIWQHSPGSVEWGTKVA